MKKITAILTTLDFQATFNRPTLLVITGPTAVGKTELTIRLAQQHHAPIVSADSRQFYREMKIGTACPTDEELQQAQHYFIGTLSIHDYYSVSKYEQDVLQLLPELLAACPRILLKLSPLADISLVCKQLG